MRKGTRYRQTRSYIRGECHPGDVAPKPLRNQIGAKMNDRYEDDLAKVETNKDKALSEKGKVAAAHDVAVDKLRLIREPTTSKKVALEAASVAAVEGDKAKIANQAAFDAAVEATKTQAVVALTAATELPSPQERATIAKLETAIDLAKQAAQDARQLSAETEQVALLATSLAHAK